MTTLHFTVVGVPVPKGSTRAFVPKGWSRPIITNDNPKTKGWQQLVAEEASRAIQTLPGGVFHVLDTGVRLTVAFYLPRPKKFQKRGTNPPHLTKPDLDKLLRAVKDALKSVAWHDDSQVVDVVAMKRYAGIDDVPHAEIWIEPTESVVALARAQKLFAPPPPPALKKPLFADPGF